MVHDFSSIALIAEIKVGNTFLGASTAVIIDGELQIQKGPMVGQEARVVKIMRQQSSPVRKRLNFVFFILFKSVLSISLFAKTREPVAIQAPSSSIVPISLVPDHIV